MISDTLSSKIALLSEEKQRRLKELFEKHPELALFIEKNITEKYAAIGAHSKIMLGAVMHQEMFHVLKTVTTGHFL